MPGGELGEVFVGWILWCTAILISLVNYVQKNHICQMTCLECIHITSLIKRGAKLWALSSSARKSFSLPASCFFPHVDSLSGH